MSVRLFVPREANQAPPATSKPIRPGSEALALLLFAVSAYVSLALWSLECDPSDPGVSGANWVGPVGATIAELLVRGFGVVAWAFPLELTLLGRPLLARRSPNVTGLRIVGNLVVAMVLSALVHVAAPDATAFGRLPFGGNVGLLFGELFEAMFSSAGSYLIGGTLVGLILIGRSSFSFIEWCERVQRLAQRASRTLAYWVRRSVGAWNSANILRRQAGERLALEGFGDETISNFIDSSPLLPEWNPKERTEPRLWPCPNH